MCQKKMSKNLNDYLELYPEGVLVKWLESKEKEHIRKLAKVSGTDLERQANKILKTYTSEQLADLRKKFL